MARESLGAPNKHRDDLEEIKLFDEPQDLHPNPFPDVSEVALPKLKVRLEPEAITKMPKIPKYSPRKVIQALQLPK